MFATLFLSIGESPSPLVSPAMRQTQRAENKTISKAVMQSEVQRAAAQQATKTKGAMESASDIMIVDPKEMAKDWAKAFTMLKSKQTGNILFHLANGKMVEDIVSIEPLEGGYLMFFTVKNLHGLHYQVIKTSEIVSLSTK